MPSFDIVSEVKMNEVLNAVDNANRELATRFDFRGVEASFELNKEEVKLEADADFQLKQMVEILRAALLKLHGIKPEHIFIEDLREEFTRDFVFPMFRANALYEGTYLLGTSIARPLISKRLIEIARETGQPLSLLLTDIDHFKKFNDTYGHQIGDLVLKEVAKVLISTAKGKDIAARYGGEEFAMIAPGRNLEAARVVAEKYRERIEKLTVKNPSNKGEKQLKVTVSVGVATFDPGADHENKHLIERTDQALYAAKHAGRNRVEIK